MKKLIIIILILSVFIPVCAMAADGTSPFFDKWVGKEVHFTQREDTILHYVYIHKNGPCSYMVFHIWHGGVITSPDLEYEMYSDSWEIVDNHVRVPTSPITYVDLFYDSKTDTLYSKDPKVTYVRLP